MTIIEGAYNRRLFSLLVGIREVNRLPDPSYIAIDLKSFYASVECMEHRLGPLTTNLVVADQRRTEKTICLAVSPSLKCSATSGRTRLFEVVQWVREGNCDRRHRASGHTLYLDGPFYADASLSPQAQKKALWNQVYACMQKRSEQSTYQYMEYRPM